MKLIGVRCGGLVVDLGSFLGSTPSGVRGEVPVMCFAVDTGDGVLVFDTGMHESCCDGRAADRYGPLLGAFEMVCPREALIDARLRQAGYVAEDIRWVTNSHLHFDHAGGNDLFPAATHLVRAREMEFARARMLKPTGFVRPDVEWLDGVATMFDYDDRHQVAPGITLVDTPGHTPGHQALEVTFAGGARYVCVGDAAYSLEAIETLRPTGYVADAAITDATLRMLRDAGAGGATLLTAHDIDQWRDVHDLVLLHEG